MHKNYEEELPPEGRGRAAKKREAKEVEQLAQHLAELSDSELGRLPKNPEMKKEIDLARSTRGHGSRKRQIKHLAGVLRNNDEQREKIEAALNGHAITQRQETLAFHHLEELRDRLCAVATFEAALAEIRTTYPQLDDNKIARLARSFHDHGDKKAAREIFRRLRKVAESLDT